MWAIDCTMKSTRRIELRKFDVSCADDCSGLIMGGTEKIKVFSEFNNF